MTDPKAPPEVLAMASALEPFAKALEEWDDDTGQPDRWDVWEHPISVGVTLGDFRKAAMALRQFNHIKDQDDDAV